jgi:hypothetical protein
MRRIVRLPPVFEVCVKRPGLPTGASWQPTSGERGRKPPSPGADPHGFAAIPPTVERLLAGTPGGLPHDLLGGAPARPDRVALILLDAFGWRFAQRHADHPLLRRLREAGSVTKVASQFPSTTTAHVTTVHTGRPVGDHGLYEWNVYEPALGEVITPILYARAGDREPDTLRGAPVRMADIVPPGTIYERLAAAGARSVVLQPSAFSPSTYDSVTLKGAELRPYPTFEAGAGMLADALAEPGYVYLYWHMIDAIGHLNGPDSPGFDAACLLALDALEGALARVRGPALVLLTADHGQMGVDPSRVDYLDDVLPEIADSLARGPSGRPLGPAGSARDVFLHAAPGSAEPLAAALRERLDGRADVRLTAELERDGRFGAVGPRLRERLADVCVLPADGRMAWLRSAAGVEQRFRGHHGGLSAAESETWLGAIMLG